jgi:hypothetical protein
MPADLGEFVAATRRWQTNAVQMPVDVKVLVVHPHRMIEVQPGIGELFAELRHGLDPHAQRIAQPVERVPTGHGRGIELEDRAHMQRLLCGFEIQETRVKSA